MTSLKDRCPCATLSMDYDEEQPDAAQYQWPETPFSPMAAGAEQCVRPEPTTGGLNPNAKEFNPQAQWMTSGPPPLPPQQQHPQVHMHPQPPPYPPHPQYLPHPHPPHPYLQHPHHQHQLQLQHLMANEGHFAGGYNMPMQPPQQQMQPRAPMPNIPANYVQVPRPPPPPPPQQPPLNARFGLPTLLRTQPRHTEAYQQFMRDVKPANNQPPHQTQPPQTQPPQTQPPQMQPPQMQPPQTQPPQNQPPQTQPPQTQPAQTQPPQMQPPQTQPAQIQPPQTQPPQTQPAQIQPAQIQPPQTQPPQTQPPQIPAAQIQPPQAQPPQTQPPQTQPAQIQPLQTQPVQTQPLQTQPQQNQKRELTREEQERRADEVLEEQRELMRELSGLPLQEAQQLWAKVMANVFKTPPVAAPLEPAQPTPEMFLEPQVADSPTHDPDVADRVTAEVPVETMQISPSQEEVPEPPKATNIVKPTKTSNDWAPHLGAPSRPWPRSPGSNNKGAGKGKGKGKGKNGGKSNGKGNGKHNAAVSTRPDGKVWAVKRTPEPAVETEEVSTNRRPRARGKMNVYATG